MNRSLLLLFSFLAINKVYCNDLQSLVDNDALQRSRTSYYNVHPITKPMTIAVPGFYILANDITGTITIDADNVIILLNHKKIMNIHHAMVINGRTNIYVYDGVIEGTLEEAISINKSSNVMLSGINFAKNATALSIIASVGIQVNGCTFTEHTSTCISVNHSQCCSLTKNRLFNNSADSLIIISHSSGITVADTLISDNHSATTIVGKAAITIADCVDCACKMCKIRGNTYFGTGIESVHSKGTVIDLCSIAYNASPLDTFAGIALRGDLHSSVTNCSINGNEAVVKPEAQAIGIAVMGAFIDGQAVHCKECFVDHNNVVHNHGSAQSVGFLQTSVEGNNVFVRNVAQGHGLNYNFFPSKYPIVTLDAATGIMNNEQVKQFDNLSIVIK